MTPYQTAQKAISTLYAGQPPNGIGPDDLGEWGSFYAELCRAWEAGGTQGVRRAFDVVARADKRLYVLIAGDKPPAEPPKPSALTDMPELPIAARVSEELGMEASPWLNDYIAHSRYWSPRSFDDFHEAIGLWILSTVAARRIVAHVGKPQYTPLCIALAGRSSIHAKTTAAEIGVDVLRAAGLDWLMADDSATPPKFIKDRTQALPDDYDSLSPEDRERARLHLAFAGQCGWWYDEFGMLLHQMARAGNVMSDFSGLLRKFDDCLPSYTHGTISRHADKVLLPYVALLASLTPADLRPLMRKGSADWTNGVWPRWAFVTPIDDEYRTDRFPPGERRPPMALVSTLRDWHERLGVPSVAIQDKATFSVGPLPSHAIVLDDAVLAAYYTYGDALMASVASSAFDELDSWHSRLSVKALRIAILLASLENGERADMRHWARAQMITERWRASVYRLYRQTNAQTEMSADATTEDQVYDIILRLGFPSIRDIKTRIATMSAGEIKEHADRLVKAGIVDAVPTGRTIRYRVATEETEEAASSVVFGTPKLQSREVKK